MVDLHNPKTLLKPVGVLILMTALILAGCGEDSVPPRSISSCPQTEQPPVEYTGGLTGLVLTPGGECTFQIDRENSAAFSFKEWRRKNPYNEVKIEVVLNELGTVTDVRLLNQADLPNNLPFYSLRKFLKDQAKWKFKDACFYGTIRYTFDPVDQKVTIDRLGLIENVAGWEGCDRNKGDSLSYISRYVDEFGHWRPIVRVVN